MLYMKKFLSLLLVLGLLGSSQAALAAEESPAPLPGWSHSILADGYSLGLFGDEIGVQHSQTVTMEQVEALARTVGDKLALLDLEPRPADGTALVLDTTRGGVVNALYQEAAAYAFPDVEQGPEAFMTSVGALAGDGSGLHLDRPCTVLEAAAMANSLILNLYDWQDAGSLGLLWRADNGRGNVLYLLGSIHTDRNNLYPFHKQLRDVILNAEQVSFELDFNDTDQLLEFAAMQTYPAGDSLANHISPALYQAVVQAAAQLGMDEGTVSQYKPWALANSFSSLATLDGTSSENAMAIDLYVNAKAINAGIDIGAVETYAFQGQIFDTLSPEYQEQYLASGLLLILDPDSISQETRDALTQVLGEDAFQPATQEAIQAQLDQISAMMDSWKARDAAEFDAVYGKDAILDSEDELNQKLFTGRDPGMIQYAADYLSQPGSHTGLLVGQIFDTLSPEYQEQYLASGLLLILDPDSISQETRDALTQVLGEDAFQPATQEAIQAQLDQISAMMDSWKARDAAEFDAVYGKDAILDSEDELNQKLFTGRDPGMIQYAADYLSQPGSHTGLLVVGAGHMVGDTGVVQGLRDLGYTVELVPVP